METTTRTKRTTRTRRNEARQALIALSKMARQLVEAGVYDNVNQAITSIYLENNPAIKVFKTFVEWKKEGYKVKKGEKGWPIWAKPIEIETGDKEDKEGEDKKELFWPLAYLFADTQVEKMNK